MIHGSHEYQDLRSKPWFARRSQRTGIRGVRPRFRASPASTPQKTVKSFGMPSRSFRPYSAYGLAGNLTRMPPRQPVTWPLQVF